MSTANRSDATAPSRVNSQSPLRRATTVMTAALTPLKTTSAPSIVFRQLFKPPHKDIENATEEMRPAPRALDGLTFFVARFHSTWSLHTPYMPSQGFFAPSLS